MQNIQFKKAKLSNNNYSCDKCPRTFAKSKQLNNHMQSHKGDEDMQTASPSSEVMEEIQYDDSVASVGDIVDASIVDEGISASTIDKNV